MGPGSQLSHAAANQTLLLKQLVRKHWHTQGELGLLIINFFPSFVKDSVLLFPNLPVLVPGLSDYTLPGDNTHCISSYLIILHSLVVTAQATPPVELPGSCWTQLDGYPKRQVCPDSHVPRADRKLTYLVTRHSKRAVKTGASLVQKGAESAAGLALKFESGGETSVDVS